MKEGTEMRTLESVLAGVRGLGTQKGQAIVKKLEKVEMRVLETGHDHAKFLEWVGEAIHQDGLFGETFKGRVGDLFGDYWLYEDPSGRD